MKVFLDTNILARFVLADVEEQHKLVTDMFSKASSNLIEFYIVPEVFVELNYVLITHYSYSKEDVLIELNDFNRMSFFNILSDYSLSYNKVLEHYAVLNLSIEDCLYLQVCIENDLELVTFDQRLEREYKKLLKKNI